MVGNLNKQYRFLCESADKYKRGMIHEKEFVNTLGSFVIFKLNNSVEPYIENMEKRIERLYYYGR